MVVCGYTWLLLVIAVLIIRGYLFQLFYFVELGHPE